MMGQSGDFLYSIQYIISSIFKNSREFYSTKVNGFTYKYFVVSICTQKETFIAKDV
jgi:hypothetical protein